MSGEGEAAGRQAGGPAGELRVTVNGEARRLPAGSGIAALLAELGLDARAVAVERNGTVVPRARLGEVELADGDHLEIVRFVQGGRVP